MESLVLIVQLYSGGPRIAWYVQDCREAVPWMTEARKWQERTGVDPLHGPMYACGSADVLLGSRPSLVAIRN